MLCYVISYYISVTNIIHIYHTPLMPLKRPFTNWAKRKNLGVYIHVRIYIYTYTHITFILIVCVCVVVCMYVYIYIYGITLCYYDAVVTRLFVLCSLLSYLLGGTTCLTQLV